MRHWLTPFIVRPMKTFPERGSAIHVVGIGGVGMNALAQVLHAKGYGVTGSDRALDQSINSPVLARLQRAGIRLFPQDGSGLTQQTSGIVLSAAIEPDNPDWQAAKSLGIPVWQRAEALAALVGEDAVIAVAGTSGKTTVTGWLGWALTELGANPNVVNGGAILNWRTPDTIGNVRITDSRQWVIEVDESDRSLLQFKPAWTVLTTISHDHFPVDETVTLFRQFLTGVRTGCVAGPEAAGLLGDISPLPLKVATAVTSIDLPTHLPGAHNLANACLVLTLCQELGYAEDDILDALIRFAGIERRLEKVGERNGIVVYDDYAHNPAKIQAAWEAIAAQSKRVLAVWRPHGYGPLAAVAEELVKSLQVCCRSQDRLFILPVYYVGGTATKQLTAEQFVAQLQAASVPAHYSESYVSVQREIGTIAEPGDAVLVMGARDPGLPELARLLAGGMAP